MGEMEAELVLDARCHLGEGPCWVPSTGRLLWVDIHAGDVHTFDPADRSDTVVNMGGCVAIALPAGADGASLVCGVQRRVVVAEAASGAVRATLCEVDEGFESNRINDGKCDPAGRLIAGTMDDLEQGSTGSLYSFSNGGGAGGGGVRAKKIQSPVTVSNGLAWSVDGSAMYYIDTPTRTVVKYKYNLQTGDVESGPEVCVRVGEDLGYPDGMTSDSEGKLWICMWNGAKITRWDPATGALLASYPVPSYNVTSCAFGGEDLQDLYVTTARKGMTAEQLEKYPQSGGLFRFRTSVKGLPAVPCALKA